MYLTHDGRTVKHLTVNEKFLEADMWRYKCTKALYRHHLEQGRLLYAARDRWLALDILRDIQRDKERIAREG